MGNCSVELGTERDTRKFDSSAKICYQFLQLKKDDDAKKQTSFLIQRPNRMRTIKKSQPIKESASKC